MATIPKVRTFTNSSVDVLNAIRNNASTDYRDYIPIATPDAESIRGIGNIIMDYPNLQNEFLTSLINRIGLVLIKNKMYTNPLKMFKKGILDYGETINEIFVDIANVHSYDIDRAEKEIYKRDLPKVSSTFHIMNYRKFYKTTVQRKHLHQAFLSANGINDLVTKIIESMYTAQEYDEFITMKYLIAMHLLNGRIHPKTVPALNKDNAKDIMTGIKEVSNDFTFLKDNYNIAKVRNFSKKDNQYLLVNSKFDSVLDVNVLASAFNMDKAQFTGHRIMVDSFGDLDVDRLNTIFEDDPNYVEITQAEQLALDQIPAIICDKDWFMIYDNLVEVTDKRNEEGLYWNYWLHVWKTFSISPYENAVVFVAGTPAITDMTIAPKAATIGIGQTVQFTVKVNTEYFAPETVVYTLDNPDLAIISAGGTLRGVKAGTVKVTATSIYDSTAKAEATITIE